ncbi:organic solute transporter Ostalpha-domain-containing protein [Exophiala viscosa]|uniref:Organic solute transporter Ostalpha-domain-containing protein n=1 Tax=Exophiala viscosa TaxID=2486360 RepID=A0AAN6IC31_9EURO|nr:organic solute transporter Ostalpha-domain-containing protein [Exophiala viscosa]
MPTYNKTQVLLIDKAFIAAYKTCTDVWVLDYSQNLPHVHIPFTTLMTILAAVACIINSIIALFLISGHLCYWVNPLEQKQIVRILLWVPFYSICAFFSIYFYEAQGYVAALAQWYEGFSITALFLLYVHYVAPRQENRANFFHRLERRWMNGKKKGDGGSLRWFRVIWIMVFQITIVRILTVVAYDFLYGFTCPLSWARQRGATIIKVFQSTSTGFAVFGVVLFETRVRSKLQEQHTLLKLVSFKGVVALEGLQDIIFPVLADTSVYLPKPPFYVSWNDFAKRISQFILVWEILIVAIVFIRSMTFEPYRQAVQRGVPLAATPESALIDSINPMDIYRGVKYMFTAFTSSTYMEGNRAIVPYDEGRGPEMDTRMESGGIKTTREARLS